MLSNNPTFRRPLPRGSQREILEVSGLSKTSDRGFAVGSQNTQLLGIWTPWAAPTVSSELVGVLFPIVILLVH